MSNAETISQLRTFGVQPKSGDENRMNKPFLTPKSSCTPKVRSGLAVKDAV